MGTEFNAQIRDSEIENNKNDLQLSNVKGPKFILSDNYPNNENLNLEEILSYHLEEKNYSFNNNENINLLLFY